MSLTTTILLLILGWFAVAAALLWGVLRITRRNQPQQPSSVIKVAKRPGRAATAH